MKKQRTQKKRKTNFWEKLSVYAKAFLIIAAAFLILGMGTLGSAQSVGKGYELPAPQSSDAKDPCIIYTLSAPDDYSRSDLKLTAVYINVGAIYTEIGSTATLRLYRSSSSTAFSSYIDLVLANGYESVAEGASATAVENGNYNWAAFPVPDTGYSLSSYYNYKLVSRTCNVLINEIVFVGVDKNLDEAEQKPLLIPAEVNANSVVYDKETDSFSNAAAIEQAHKTIDAQHIPSLAQSSFFRFGEEEAFTLRSVSEMNMGSDYYSADVYSGDRVYNSLGTIILAFGTLIFGMSPFGLRFFPMLASFGILLLGFFFVKKLTKSEKAGLIFAVIYALSGLSLSFGHLGSPLTVGIFFLFASLYLCYGFFEKGIEKAKLSGALPVVGSAILSAAAICVNGAFLIPVLGIVALFIAGVIRQKRRARVALDAAVEEAEIAQSDAETAEAEQIVSSKQKVADVLNEYSYKNKIAISMFTAFLVLGTILISMLGVLPMYFTYLKLYADPTATANVLSLIWKAFIGGFTGVNATSATQSAYSLWYTLYQGSGAQYAVTATGILPAIAAVLIGLCGIVFMVVLLVKSIKAKKWEFVGASVTLSAGIAICLIMALLAKCALAFLFGGCLLSFLCAAFVSYGVCDGECKKGKIVTAVCGVALAVCFLLFAPFTFSIPLPSGFMTAIFG